MATLRDVAKRAKVSLATASRVVNGYVNVQEDTRKRVLDAVHDLNYSYIYREHSNKNFRISVLVSKESSTDSIQHPSIHAVTMGILQCCSEMKYMNSMVSVDVDDRQMPYQIIDESDACILLGTNKREEDTIIPLLQEQRIPFIVINRWLDELHVSYVNVDDFSAISDTVVLMHERGCRKFGFLNGNLQMRHSINRIEGFKDGCKRSGISICNDWILADKYDLFSGIKAAEYISKLKDKPEIMLCSSDILAWGFMQGISKAGLKIPDDISVVGFGDVDFAANLQPSLTTIRMPAFNLGYEAVKALMTMTENPTIMHIKLALTCNLIERESTKKTFRNEGEKNG